MVRLKVQNRDCGFVAAYSFNSKMVRLKDFKEFVSLYAENSFNSKMVRLKEFSFSALEYSMLVSIPKWFD